MPAVRGASRGRACRLRRRADRRERARVVPAQPARGRPLGGLGRRRDLRRRDRRRPDRRDHRLEARRRRLRPVSDRLVVHPRALGADLRLHPQDRVRPATRRAPWLEGGGRLLRHRRRNVRRLHRDDRDHVRPGRPRDGRLCAYPADLPVDRPRCPGRDVRPHAHHDRRHLQARLRQGGPRHVRRLERLSGHDRPGSLGSGIGLYRQRARPALVRARHAGARAVHAVLPVVSELGRDPLR